MGVASADDVVALAVVRAGFAELFSAGSLSSRALTSRKWYRTIIIMAHEPRKMAKRYRSPSEIIVKVEKWESPAKLELRC